MLLVTAIFIDENNNPVSNAILFFESKYGTVPSTVNTGSDGKAFITYVPDVGNEDVLDEINMTVSVGSASTSLMIHLLGINMQISATPNSIPADGISTSHIEVHLKLTSSQIAIPNKNISFSSKITFLPAIL